MDLFKTEAEAWDWIAGEYDGEKPRYAGLCVMIAYLRQEDRIGWEMEEAMQGRLTRCFRGRDNDNIGYWWAGPSHRERAIAAGLLAEICRGERV